MSSTTPPKLVNGNLNRYEEEIVSFYQKVGDSTGLNAKNTRIFAYLQVYGELTQKQLKQLTNFSTSTISTTLNSFIQSGIVTREIGPNARLGIYRLKSRKVPFIYTEFTEIMAELELLDEFIFRKIEEIQNYTSKYPNYSQYFIRRLNSFRNYIEAQRRAIKNTQKFSFFPEDTSDIKDVKLSEIPEELGDLIKKIVMEIINNAIYDKDDSIANIIFTYMSMYKNTTQEFLVEATGLSLSTISRALNHFIEQETITALPKQYKKSRIYQLPSLSLSIINQILKADDFIFSWIPKFETLLKELENSKTQNVGALNLLNSKMSLILQQIQEFIPGSDRLEKSKSDILKLYQ